MIVVPERRCVLWPEAEPHRVTSVIPSARTFTYNGQTYVAVPHKPTEVRVLRNLGYAAPSPILYHYQWPGLVTPYAHQKETAAFLTLHSRCYNLNDLGTGKTLSTLWAYDFLRSAGVFHKALIVAPLSTLDRVWADEIFRHFRHLRFGVLHGERDKRLQRLDDRSIDIYIINHDGLKVRGMIDAFEHRPDIDIVIIDELTQAARNASSGRFKMLNTIVNKQGQRACWGLTGAPTPKAPTDAWAQCRLLTPAQVPPYGKRFRDMVMRQTGTFTWVPRDDAADIVSAAMQPSIRFARQECIDLPPCVKIEQDVELTEEQTEAYKSMMRVLVVEAREGRIVAVNDAVKAQKLLQIACGAAYDGDGGVVDIDAVPRLEAVHEIIGQASAKAIVFVPFISALDKVAEYLRQQGHTIACIHGGVSKGERDNIIHAFQNEASPRVLVAQPASMSHGLTLTAADTIIWYAPITSNDIFEQANARIVRPGQKNKQLIAMLSGTAIERRYYKRLRDRQSLQGVLLDIINKQKGEGHG